MHHRHQMIEKTTFKGFDAVKLTNNKKDELIVLTAVGPRIISFKPEGRENFFYVNNSDLQKAERDLTEWYSYGGTRLWTSPELKLSYTPDNVPVDVTIKSSTVNCTTQPDKESCIRKFIEIEVKEESFRLTYGLINDGPYLAAAGIWVLSCIAPSNDTAIYLPWGDDSVWNVKDMKYWRSWLEAGTDIRSQQWDPTNEFFTIHPTGETGKVGFINRHGFVLYQNNELSFIKRSSYIESAHYPDDGCSFEVYTSKDFYELESLSPLFTLRPGVTFTHEEEWWAGYEKIDTKSIAAVKSFMNGIFL